MAESEQDPQFTAEGEEAAVEETPEEAAKRKFREALERKRSASHGSAGGGRGGSKIHGTHSQAGGKRTFRRKAGG
ncbi:DUF5302 domain-containing protein [Actinocorallia sp. API 0066]|uniref:DUF5302 domain-containing protein n=1 Tax=Actinocorallia sp. API 0066 TaxID=2896846 RepID=UPI001E5A575B|nr:DUF5302 domain-containing protein [Actinocorallia sp. API 0066]MCD0449498.1 DUF5302 domain-containing protein [Actinocorallia sp. API 0066]